MDIIGAVGAVVGIVDVLGRTISKLYEVQTKLKNVPVTLIRLSGELAAAKVALQQLQNSLESRNGDDLHYSVVMDLESSLSCCQLLLGVVEAKIPDANSNQENLAFKIQIILADQETTKCLECLSRILLALNIVRESVERNEIYRQCEVIHQSRNRQLLDQIKDDSSSLIVLWDKASFSSSRKAPSSLRSSRLSLRFPGLDNILLQHTIYQKTFRSLIRRVSSAKAQTRALATSVHEAHAHKVPAHEPPVLEAPVLVCGDRLLAHSTLIRLNLSQEGDAAQAEKQRILVLAVSPLLQAMSFYLRKVEARKKVGAQVQKRLLHFKIFLDLIRNAGFGIRTVRYTPITRLDLLSVSQTLGRIFTSFQMTHLARYSDVGWAPENDNQSHHLWAQSRIYSKLHMLEEKYQPDELDIRFAASVMLSFQTTARAAFAYNGKKHNTLTWPSDEFSRYHYIESLSQKIVAVFLIDLKRVRNEELPDLLVDFEYQIRTLQQRIWPNVLLLFHKGSLAEQPDAEWVKYLTSSFEERLPEQIQCRCHVLNVNNIDETLQRIWPTAGESRQAARIRYLKNRIKTRIGEEPSELVPTVSVPNELPATGGMEVNHRSPYWNRLNEASIENTAIMIREKSA